MTLFLIEIYFEDGRVIEKVYMDTSAFDAMDQALNEYPAATGAGHSPSHQHYVLGGAR